MDEVGTIAVEGVITEEMVAEAEACVVEAAPGLEWPGMARVLAEWSILDERAEAAGYWFDGAAGEAVVDWIETYCVHIKGEWQGQPLRLSEWQRFIIRRLFGWKGTDGLRRFRTALIFIPRKNGKSTLCAAIALYLTYADNEPGAEVYSAAADLGQARMVFDVARHMVTKSKGLSKFAVVKNRRIEVARTVSTYEVLTRDAETKHGFNAHGVVSDETHAQRSRELHDVLATSTGARRQPLVIDISTAGYDRLTLLGEIYDYAKSVIQGRVVDHSFFAFIAEASETDDPFDEATWLKANPGYGVSVKAAYIRGEFAKASVTPGYKDTVLRLHLNLWTSASAQHVDMGAWAACVGPTSLCELRRVDDGHGGQGGQGGQGGLDFLKGRPCYGGLDLSATQDLTSFALFFPPCEEDALGYVLSWSWLPEERVMSQGATGAPYRVWRDQGHLLTTPGAVIDDDIVIETVAALCETWQPSAVAFDRWGASRVRVALEKREVNMVQFGQGFKSFSPAMKALDKLVIERRLRHGGHPVLTWAAGNVVAETDPAGNIKPSKAKSTQKIDPYVALTMAVGVWDALAGEDDCEGVSYQAGSLAVVKW